MDKILKQHEQAMKIQTLMLLLAYERWMLSFEAEVKAIEEIIK